MGPLFPATKQALADSADQGGADSLTHIAAGALPSRGRQCTRVALEAPRVSKKRRSDIRICISGNTQALIDSHRRRHPPIHPTIRDYVSLVYLLLTFLICRTHLHNPRHPLEIMSCTSFRSALMSPCRVFDIVVAAMAGNASSGVLP